MILTALFLILLVLIQRGSGGGLAGAFGGMGGQSAFGTKAGDMFTRITIGVAAFWIVLCIVSLKLMGGGIEPLGDEPGGAAPANVPQSQGPGMPGGETQQNAPGPGGESAPEGGAAPSGEKPSGGTAEAGASDCAERLKSAGHRRRQERAVEVSLARQCSTDTEARLTQSGYLCMLGCASAK